MMEQDPYSQIILHYIFLRIYDELLNLRTINSEVSRYFPTTAEMHDVSDADNDEAGFEIHESNDISVNLNMTACMSAFCCSITSSS